jgi:hypothetical protein
MRDAPSVRKLVTVLGPEAVDEAMGQGHRDRRSEHRLGEDHGARREQEAQGAERSGSRHQQIDEEADDDRRQPEERVRDRDEHSAAAEAQDGQRRAEGSADQEGEHGRAEADPQREADDLAKLGIEAEQKLDREGEGAADVVHRRPLARLHRGRAARKAAAPVTRRG